PDGYRHRVDCHRVCARHVLHAPPVVAGRGIVVTRYGDFDVDPLAVGRYAAGRIGGDKGRQGISASGTRDDRVAASCQVRTLDAKVVDVDAAREDVIAVRIVDIDSHEAGGAGDVTGVPKIDADRQPGIVRREPEQLHGEAPAWASIKRGEEGHVVPG